jgi:type II secretory pathway pseudopilin PulG
MKTIAKQSNRKAAFTIVELLTVMSIIVILIGLLVPALNRVRIYAREVKQNAQFHSLEAAIELFNNAFDGYPESGGLDSTKESYCGAMKLCEAMMGQDLLGFHSNSVFRRDGRDATGTVLIYNPADLSARKGPYLPPESADAVEVQKIWPGATGPFLATSRVLCDVYTRKLASGTKLGMPILYYKADTRASLHDASLAGAMTPLDNQNNIYNFYDNQELLELGVPGAGGGGAAAPYALVDPIRFYKNTLSDKITTIPRPFRADTYILISAGYDAEYGTADDICNFDWRYVD